jgi:hypothetical protein
LAATLYALFVRHGIRPGEFWRLPRGEQLFLLACLEIEIESEKKGVKVRG